MTSDDEPGSFEVEKLNKNEQLVGFVKDSFSKITDHLAVYEPQIDEIGLDLQSEKFSATIIYATPAGIRRSDIGIPRTTEIGEDITGFEMRAIAHEVGHILVNSDKKNRIWKKDPVQHALDEGIVEAAAIDFMVSEYQLPLDYKNIEMNLKDLVAANEGLIRQRLNDHKTIVEGDDTYFDGYLTDRSIGHIAGMNFVLQVLGPYDLHKWRYLKDNPPSPDELINPESYLQRHKSTIETVINPREKINSDIEVVIVSRN